MKRMGMFLVLAALLALGGCNGGSGGGSDSSSGITGNYHTQFWNDHTNLFGDDAGFGDSGVIATDLDGTTFSGIGIGMTNGQMSQGMITWTVGDDTTDVKLVYQVRLGNTGEGGNFAAESPDWDTDTREGGGLTITLNNVPCPDSTPCYFHYIVSGGRVFDHKVNPTIAVAASASAMTTEDFVSWLPEELGPVHPTPRMHTRKEFLKKFQERFGYWQR